MPAVNPATWWLLVGVLLGAAATAAIVAVRMATRRPAASTVLSTQWRLAELTDPIVVVRELSALDVPSGTRILCSGMVDAELQARCVVRRIPTVAAEFALDAGRKRAILWLAGATQGAVAALTTDAAMLERLDRDARMLWDRAQPYVEHHSISSLAGRAGITVETTGRVRDAVPYHGQFLLSLEDAGAAIGVVVDRDPAALRGERVQVRGGLVKDERGYSTITAVDVRRVR